jgi:hypothetical protein
LSVFIPASTFLVVELTTMLLGSRSFVKNPVVWAIIAAILLFLTYHSSDRISSSTLLNKYRYTPTEDSAVHPIQQLARTAHGQHLEQIKRQSTTYDAAVLAYNTRYNRLPPPGFQKWFEFARANDCPIIDDFDVMERDLAPFRKISGKQYAANIARIWNSGPHSLWGCNIKDGNMTECPGELIKNMENVTNDIPDVSLPFNPLDEARVIIGGNGVDEHQPYWDLGTHTNMWHNMTGACDRYQRNTTPYYPPARNDTAVINTYGLPFTTSSLRNLDVCSHDPEWKYLHGFWSTPTVDSTTQNLIPVLSCAAPSSMHDIVFPAVAYTLGMYSWNEAEAVAWEDKTHGVYWAGSTTGTHIANWSTHWEDAHRERLVLLANHHDKEKEFTYLQRNTATGKWQRNVSRAFNKEWYHAFFTNIVQCMDGGCEMIKELFAPYITEGRPRGENSKYTLVFDSDGNGHSGRYYRLLMSHSLPLKHTVFREWHDDRLIPWVHFVPVSLGMEEVPETVRYLVDEEEGRALAKQLAEKGREWAMKSLRPVDQAAYVYRLALEMVRLQDPSREAEED